MLKHMTQRAVAKHFGVSKSTLANAVNGKTWRHLDRSAA